MKLLKLQSIIVITLVSINVLNAQESKKSSFTLMSSHGFMRTDGVSDGYGQVNTVLYAPDSGKIWAYGLDIGLSQGRYIFSDMASTNRPEMITKTSKMFIAPSVYVFPVNTDKHQVYAGASIGFGCTNYTRLIEEIYIDQRSMIANLEYDYSWSEKNEMGITFGANAGYNYKFCENWMVGARVYTQLNLEFLIGGLVNIGVTF